MNPNPFLGVCFHWLGGLASGSFYVPYRRVRNWAWETYWLVGGFFSWIIAPWVLGLTMTNDLCGVLSRTPSRTLFYAWLFGALWGIGGLTFGLTMRYLGMSLGMGVALGFCAAFGTLVPPIFNGQLTAIASTGSGKVTLFGVGVCLTGIAIAALAGLSKERELSDEKKKGGAIKEFNFRKGMLVAILRDHELVLRVRLDAGAPISELCCGVARARSGQGLPKLVVVLLGRLHDQPGLVRCAQCAQPDRLLVREPPPSAFAGRRGRDDLPGLCYPRRGEPLLLRGRRHNVVHAQFFFYTMGETQMGRFRFSSWTLHMASIIIFSTMWGWILHEWKRSEPKNPSSDRSRHSYPDPLHVDRGLWELLKRQREVTPAPADSRRLE